MANQNRMLKKGEIEEEERDIEGQNEKSMLEGQNGKSKMETHGDGEKGPKSWDWKAYIACLMASMVGGAILVFWELKYHPTNRQLWMVPFGLILFPTPLFIWFSSIVSDFCCPSEGNSTSDNGGDNALEPQPNSPV